ncbi:MAG: hypothetical protein V1872_12285 [bacterium]
MTSEQIGGNVKKKYQLIYRDKVDLPIGDIILSGFTIRPLFNGNRNERRSLKKCNLTNESNKKYHFNPFAV